MLKNQMITVNGINTLNLFPYSYFIYDPQSCRLSFGDNTMNKVICERKSFEPWRNENFFYVWKGQKNFMPAVIWYYDERGFTLGHDNSHSLKTILWAWKVCGVKWLRENFGEERDGKIWVNVETIAQDSANWHGRDIVEMVNAIVVEACHRKNLPFLRYSENGSAQGNHIGGVVACTPFWLISVGVNRRRREWIKEQLAWHAEQIKLWYHNDKLLTCLLGAVACNDLVEVKRLIAEKANSNVTNNKDVVALMCAATKGATEIVQILLGAGAYVNTADKGSTALIWAALTGQSKAIQVLLNAGANVNATDKGSTALMSAAIAGNTETAQVLLDAGINVNATSNNGVTSLMLAVSKGNTETVETLLNAGANINVANTSGWTSLMHAAAKGHVKVVKILLDAGANVNATDKSGWTVLMHAAMIGHAEVAKILLDAGANVNATSKHSLTALMHVAVNGYPKTAKVLLDAGANINAKNKDGRTALHYATPEVARLLKWHINGYHHAAGVH